MGKDHTSVKPAKRLMPFINGRLDAFKWVGTVLGAVALGATFGVYLGGSVGTAIGTVLGAVGGATVVATDTYLHRKPHG